MGDVELVHLHVAAHVEDLVALRVAQDLQDGHGYHVDIRHLLTESQKAEHQQKQTRYRPFHRPLASYESRSQFNVSASTVISNHPFYRVASISALMVCLRFSDWSHTREAGPSITSTLTSLPLTAGRQCRKMASALPVAFIMSRLTW